ncbi:MULTISPECIES: MFS transporter [unclassified Paenibacillus]|uniref:MFS transporter n=1 Tax=unclassified Paenibacillus TaxID=185978 RepID=UPI001AEB7C0E|nr:MULTISPECIES: MFS transporter [unclassified Paenibacillus]MBP1154025.1 CP family cyanate transporter-like MFS transporter [Paenibacillus sp. PvP091]MBP1170590.1 CP family cyanate transporter-like MFS transporter [Paenibacillus sp. PvR098]MBP2441618.1 CP family cyanate transporter-like MFS transporter [Paenibacillus sp. PvP052]
MKMKYGLMVVAFFVAALNSRPAINSIAPLLEIIRNDLSMSASIASLLTSIPVLCMGIFSPIAAKLSSKWGIERMLGWSLFIIGVGIGLRVFTHSTAFLLITAMIAGLGMAAAGPLLSGFIRLQFQNHVPSMIGVYTVALTLGATLSSGLSAPLQEVMHSWQKALGLWAVVAFLAVLVWWLFVTPHVQEGGNPLSSRQADGLPWTNKKAWMLTLSFGLMAMLFYSLTAWLPPIIQGMGYSKAYAAMVLTIFVFVQIPISFVLPMLLKRFPSRLHWLLAGAVLELIGLLMIALSMEPWIAAIFLGLGAGGLFPLNLLLPLDAARHAHEATTWSAMTQSVGYVIGAAGPIILGWIYDATSSFSFAVAGMIVINLAMIIVQLAAVPRKDIAKAD